jgi:DNA-binding NarL/FixJ family response regulator
MARTILIVDDSPLIRSSLRTCIEGNTDWTICGEAENGRIAIEKVTQLQPAVVILDWQMPVMNGLDAAREISRIAPTATLIMITMHESAMLSEEASAAGITEVLSKSSRVAESLLASLNKVTAAN